MPPLAWPPAPALDRPRGRALHVRLAWWGLRRAGWSVVLAEPVPPRCLIVIYPHTSNWDFVVGLAAKWAIGIAFRWVGKDTLFRSPLGPWFRHLGGIAVNRRERTGFIAAMQKAFGEHSEFRLVMAPEGTRSAARYWRSGFYHLARAANVPLGLAFLDYARREIGIGAFIDLTGDVASDMARIADFYATKAARRPGSAAPVRLPPTDTPVGR